MSDHYSELQPPKGMSVIAVLNDTREHQRCQEILECVARKLSLPAPVITHHPAGLDISFGDTDVFVEKNIDYVISYVLTALVLGESTVYAPVPDNKTRVHPF